ncbi:hypothetical protein AB1Y20_009684 [Prymnesium parvum]|uniref:Uncharacterized protein n=1 Tax=Prymnesium parvum TaxID=97485 RepID=A0AB34K2A4_PRYPA
MLAAAHRRSDPPPPAENLEPLLEGVPGRSDHEPPAAPAADAPGALVAADALLLTIESLVPVRGHVLSASLSQTVAQLKAEYAARLLEETVAIMLADAERRAEAPRRVSLSDAHAARFDMHVRLIFDGRELADEMVLAEVAGLQDGSRLVALAQKHERGLGQRLVRTLVRWWPLIGVLLLAVVFTLEVCGLLPGTRHCDRPLVAFLIVTAGILLPYGLVISGLYQEDRGNRLLWFMQSQPLARMMFGTTLMTFIWCIVGAVWLFGSDGCRESAPQLHYVALVAWIILMIINAPLIVVLSLPFMLCCKCSIAFKILSFMSGVNRSVVRVDVDRSMHI